MREIQFESLIIDSCKSIKDAMKALDQAASQILFVINGDSEFIGTLSDGDLRRSILNNISLDESILDSCQRNCYSLKANYDPIKVNREMNQRGIFFAPVLDSSGKIIDVYSLPESHKEIVHKIKKNLDIPVVIMAGGKGTRLKPFTDVFPKPLVPINEKPIMDWIIQGFKKYGIKNFYATLNYKGKMIEAYYDSIDKSYNIDFVWEKSFCGTAGSLSLLKDRINSTFIVSNCDILVKADYSDVYSFHKTNKSMLTVVSSMQHIKVPYGVMDFEDGGFVRQIQEKPEFTYPINTGVYILEEKCLDYIPDNKFFHITHLMETLIENGERVMTYPVNENDYIDIGQWEEYRSNLDRVGFGEAE